MTPEQQLRYFDESLDYQIAIRDLCMTKGDNLDTITAKLKRISARRSASLSDRIVRLARPTFPVYVFFNPPPYSSRYLAY